MYRFTLNEEMVRIVGSALENAPYRTSAPVLKEIQRQIDEQNKSSEE